MSVASTYLWLIAIGLGLLAAIPYAIVWIALAVTRKWRRLALVTALPVVGLVLLQGVTGCLDAVALRQYRADTYDVDVPLGDPIFEYHSERHFNGDGYSFEVYHLPDALRKRFESADQRLSSQFPRRSPGREHWDVQPWKEAPTAQADVRYISFGMLGDKGDLGTSYEREIESALGRRGTFYAFLKYDHNDSDGTSKVGNVDLFIVDLVLGRVYEINVNT